MIDQIIMTDTLDPETGETTSVVSVPEGFAEQALQGTRVFGQLLPAVVISVEEKNAKVIDSDQNEHTLTLKDSRWARTYIDVDNRGPRVSDLTTVIAPGDIIRIQPVEKNGTTTWRLAQLPEIQGAVVAMEPTTGSIKALVGGFDFYRNQYNHALQSARQPGSSFKPFIYSAALANGVNAADVFLDAPLVFEDANLESQYRPENDNNRYNGPTRLREALYLSLIHI